MREVGGASQAVTGEDGRPPAHALPVEFVIPPALPAEFATHIWVYDFGPEHGAYELTLHRVNAPMPRVQRDEPSRSIEAVTTQCVARVVLTDATMRAMLLLLGRVTGERTRVQLVDLEEARSEGTPVTDRVGT